MAKQTFKTPLNFQQVDAGTLEDKVLVRSADGDVKEVPSSSFGGSGGSQDINEVLQNGDTATNKKIKLTDSSNDKSTMGIYPNQIDILKDWNDEDYGTKTSFASFDVESIGNGWQMLDEELGNYPNAGATIGYNGGFIHTKADDTNNIKNVSLDIDYGLWFRQMIEGLAKQVKLKPDFDGSYGGETGAELLLPLRNGVLALLEDISGIEVSKLEFDDLVANESLKAGLNYLIKGVDNGWCDIIVKAISNNSIAISGIGIFKNPDYNTYQIFSDTIGGFTFSDLTGTFEYGEEVTSNNGAKAIFYTQNVMKYISGDWEASTNMTGGNSGATVNISDTYNPEAYNIDDIVIWGGSHWKNVTGLVSASLDEFNLDENWIKTDEGTKEVGDKIEYNYEGNFISMRSDINGNVIRSRSSVKGFQWGRNEHIFNNISEFGGEVLNIQELSLRFNSVKNCFLESKYSVLTVRDINMSTFNMERITGAVFISDCVMTQMNLSDIDTQLNLQYINGQYANFSNHKFPPEGASIKNVDFKIGGNSLSNIDFSTSTILLNTDFQKTVYRKSTGDYKIAYMNSSDVLTVADIDA